MITKILLENFKCFRKVEVNPRRITVFVGPNGSGKSSVLQAVALLKQSVGSRGLQVRGSLLHVNDAEDLSPKFPVESSYAKVGFGGIERHLQSWDTDKCIQYEYGADLLHHSGALASYDGGITFQFQNRPYLIEAQDDPVPIPSYTTMEIGPYAVNLRREKKIAQIVLVEGWLKPPPHELQAALVDIFDSPNVALSRLRVVPAVRGLVRPAYPLGTDTVEDVSLVDGLTGQEEQIATNLGYARELEARLSDWLRRVTDVTVRGRVIPPGAVAVEAITGVGAVPIVAEGFGTNALILLFMQLASASKGATVLIEEPEIHLHPRAQAELASLMAEVADDEDKQLIMTTHSEHIVGRFLTLGAEKKLSPDELAVYAFEKDVEGVCTATELEVTEDGRVVGGIKDFFEPGLDELERYISALQPTE